MKEYDAKRGANPQRKACKKEHNAAYYAKRKAFPCTSISANQCGAEMAQ